MIVEVVELSGRVGDKSDGWVRQRGSHFYGKQRLGLIRRCPPSCVPNSKR